MTIDSLLKTIYERKLQKLTRVRLPLLLLVLLGTLVLAGAGYYWVGAVFSMIAGLPAEAVIRGSFILGLFFSLLPITFSFIRSATLRNDLNEALISLPISAGNWIARTTSYYYLSQSPIFLGFFIAIALSILFKTEIPLTEAAGLLALILSITLSVYFLAVKLTALALHKNSIIYFVSASLGFICLVSAMVYLQYKVYFRESASGSIWHAPELLAALSAVLITAIFCSIIVRYSRRFKTDAIPYADESVRISLYRKGKPKTRRFHLYRVILAVISRDKKTWTIILVNCMLAAMGLILAMKARSASYNTFLITFLPTLLIIGAASVLAEVRGSLGASRSSIYYLPVTPAKLILSLTIIGIFFGTVSVILPAGISQRLIAGNIDWPTLYRLAMTMTLATQAAVLASVLFYESKRDISRGILAGIAMFLLTWPILIGSDWLRQKGQLMYLVITVSAAALIFYMTVKADKKLQAMEFA